MNDTLLQSYGPIYDKNPETTELKKYLRFSEQAFLLAQELTGNDVKDWNTIEKRLLTFLNYHALNTSYSVRILNTYAQFLEAFALLRVRLEQLFICSYLIHSEYEDGFSEYIQDIDRSDFRLAESIKNQDPTLFSIIEKIFPDKLNNARKKAFINENLIDPNYDFENDRLKRKWCKLNTYDMCKDRDKRINQKDPIQSIKHQYLYLSIYKSSSAYIHAEPCTLTENFINISNGKIESNLAYLQSNLVNLVLVDIIQCYEVVKFIKPNNTQKILDLYFNYSLDVNNDYRGILSS